MSLAIFGGTFNPIHNAHVAAAEAAQRAFAAERLLLVPSAQPPHKPGLDLAPAAHRLRMAELAARGRPGWLVSDIEIRRRGPSYSIDTVREVTREFALSEPPFFLIGADMFEELHLWRDVRELAKLCRFAVAARPGHSLAPSPALVEAIGEAEARAICSRRVPAPLLDISSSDIRRRVRAGLPFDRLVPPAVAEYIRRHRLYAE